MLVYSAFSLPYHSQIYGKKLYDCCCVFFKKLKRFKAVVVSCSDDITTKRRRRSSLEFKAILLDIFIFHSLIKLMHVKNSIV